MLMVNIRKLEADLCESADLLRQGSKLTSNQYCMPVLGLIFLRYCKEVEGRANDMIENLMWQMAKAEGVTEQLKAENQMKWVGRMNNIRQAVNEVVMNELIYI
jgi:hypothetical protein